VNCRALGVRYPELRENAFVERHRCDATAVATSERLWSAVAAPHADSLGKDLLQLRRRSARYQRPNQRQRVVVEVRLRYTPHPQSRTELLSDVHSLGYRLTVTNCV